MKKLICFPLCIVLILSVINISCSTSKKTQGAVIGATIGGAAGALLTKNNKAVGILVGAAIGGVAGGLIGNYMDNHARDIAKELEEDATVTRIDEGIVVSFNSGLLFDYNSADLRNTTKENLGKLATSLNKYESTNINVLGHTDSKGTNEYNLKLSENRARSVGKHLASLGVENTRINPLGLGESDPVADNETEESRQLNRRVEIVIVASDKLKEAAKAGNMPAEK